MRLTLTRITSCLLGVLLGLSTGYAQRGLELTLHQDSLTAACIDALAELPTGDFTVVSPCDRDYDGNPVAVPYDSLACEPARQGCFSAVVSALDERENDYLEVRLAFGSDAGGTCGNVDEVKIALPPGGEVAVSGLLLFPGGAKAFYQTAKHRYEAEVSDDGAFLEFAVDGAFVPGDRDTLAFTLLYGVDYADAAIRVEVDANGDYVLSVPTDCERFTVLPDDAADVYRAGWDSDYFVPGGTGCTDGPLLVRRAYVAEDACGNTARAVQTIVVATECDEFGDPMACGDTPPVQRQRVPSTDIWQPEHQRRAVIWPPVEADRGGSSEGPDSAGYYLVTRIWQPEGTAIWQPEAAGRVAPTGADEYTFGHEAFGSGDSIRVEWVTEAQTSPVRRVAEVSRRLAVFPNPGTDGLNVRLDAEPYASTGAQVTVTSVLGQRLAERSLAPGTEQVGFATADWLPGVYIVEVVYPDGERARTQWVLRR